MESSAARGGCRKPLLLVSGPTAKAGQGERAAVATVSHGFVPAAEGEVQRWARLGMVGTGRSAGCRMSPALTARFF